jgi:hypothetical protein
MPQFTIETTYDVPHFRHTTYEADTLEAALALAAADQEWDNQKADFDASGEERQTGAWAGDTAYHGAQLIPPAPPSKVEQMEALLRGVIEAFPEVDNDDEIGGSDAVEFLCGFINDAKKLFGLCAVGQDERAALEGWCLIEGQDGSLAIEADHDSPIFCQNGVADNDRAEAFVCDQAAAGSAYHVAVLGRIAAAEAPFEAAARAAGWTFDEPANEYRLNDTGEGFDELDHNKTWRELCEAHGINVQAAT